MIFLCCQIISPKICLVITCKIMYKERHSQNKHPCKVEHLFPRNTLLWGYYLTWSVFYIRYKIIAFCFFFWYPRQTRMVWKEKRRGQALWQEKCLLEWGFCFSKCLASCKGKVLLDNMPSRYIRSFFCQCFTWWKKLVLVNKDECQFSQCLDLAYLC
jgi:hypothetical protein